MKNFKKSASLNATSEAMESKNHFKNAASPKSQRVGINFLAYALLIAVLLCGFCLNGYAAPPPTIKISKEPAKTVYGQGQDFDKTGLEIILEDKKKTEVVDTRQLKFSGYDKNKPGEQTVTVTYTKSGFFSSKDFSTTFTVTVVPVKQISIEQLPAKTVFLQGDDFEPAGLVAQVEFENEAIPAQTVGLNQLNLSGYSKNVGGVQLITVDYYGKKATFEVKVSDFMGITVTSPPNNTQYFTGEDIDLTGLVVTGNWDGAGEKPVSITQKNLSSFDRYRSGTQDVLISYLGKTTTFPVTYLAMQSLSVTTPPQKLEYNYGEELDLIGLNVQGTRQGATTIELVDVSRMKVSGYDRFNEGNQTVTLTLGGKTTNFRVTVKPNPFIGVWRINSESQKYELRISKDNQWELDANGATTIRGLDGTWEAVDKQTILMKNNDDSWLLQNAVLVAPDKVNKTPEVLKVRAKFGRIGEEETLIFIRKEPSE